MARYAPVSLMLLPIVWALGVMVGFVPLYWAVGVDDWSEIFTLTGSSLATLGYARLAEGAAGDPVGDGGVHRLGPGRVAHQLLPTICSHFSSAGC